LYYVEMGPGSSLTLHRGGKDGAIIGTAEPCTEKQGSSKIQYTDPESTIVLEHIPRKMLVMPPKTTFTHDGKKYYWKGYSGVFEEKSDKLVGYYTPKTTEGADANTGTLLITQGDNKQLEELIVLCTVVMQQRSEGRKRAVS
jgi:hypothetical protein